MNDLVTIPPPAQTPELICANGQRPVIVRANPFSTVTRGDSVPRGLTVEQIVDHVVRERFRPFARVYIGGVFVPRSQWSRVKPRDRAEVIVTTTPQGGGNKGSAIGEIILGIVVIIASIVSFQFYGVSAGVALMAGTSGAGLVIGGGVGLMMGTPSMAQLSDTEGKKSNAYSISGAQNQSRPWEAVPQIVGAHKISPDYAAPPYTELVGDNQYLRLLFCVGNGPLALSDFKIGDTPIDDFDDVEMEVRNGFPGDAPVTLYPTTVVELPLSVELSTDWSLRTSPENVDEIVVEVSFPRGLILFQVDGDKKSRSVTFEIEYRPFGSGDDAWESYDDGSGNTIKGKKTEPFARGFRWTVDRGQYDVRVRRTTAESTDTSVQDKAVWSVLRTFQNDNPLDQDRIFYNLRADSLPTLNYKGALALVALRIKATDQLNSVINTFSCKAKSIFLDHALVALELDGEGHYLDGGDVPESLCGTSERAFECWACADEHNGGLFQAGLPGVAGGDFSLRILDQSTETWRINLWGSANNIDVVLPDSIGNWHHYALTVKDGYINLYFDGVLASQTATSGLANFDTQSGRIEIGRWNQSEYFNGQIRDFRVWKKGLTAAQVLAAKDNVILTYQADLLHYWMMNEGAGETIYDYAGSLHLDAVPAPEALKCSFQMIAATDGYQYIELRDVADYTIVTGDVLTYDVYWPEDVGDPYQKIALDVHSTNVMLRSSGAVDQHELSADPGTDIRTYGGGKWYRRSIELPASMTGESLTKVMIGCEANTGGDRVAWIKNINILGADGDLKLAVWNTGDALPTTRTDDTSDSDQSYEFEIITSAGLVASPSWYAFETTPDGWWEPRPTANPASVWRAILQGANNKAAIADARIDIAGLETWHDRCIEKSRSVNFIFDFSGSVFEALQTVAVTGRASTTMRDGKFSIVEDKPRTVPVQHFTPRNCVSFSGQKIFKTIPNALRLRIVDEDDDYKQGEVVVYDDDFTAANADSYQVVDLKGITSKDQAWKFGRYMLAVMRLRPETFQIQTDIESIVCTRGDLVRLSYDVISVGQCAGRIKSVALDENNYTVLTLDEQVAMEAGKSYAIRARSALGATVVKTVATVAGESNTVSIHSDCVSSFASGELFMFGELGLETMECLVSEIEPRADLGATLTLIPENAAIHTAEDDEIPPYDPYITYDPDILHRVQQPQIRYILSDEQAMLITPDGSYRPRIIVALIWPSGTAYERADYMQAMVRESGSESPYRQVVYADVGGSFIIDHVEVGESYDIRVRGVTRLGRASAWTEISTVVIGDVTPPPDVDRFWAQETWGANRTFNWSYAVALPRDYVGAYIRYRSGTNPTWVWDDLSPMHSGILTGFTLSTDMPFLHGEYTFMIRGVDRAGNLSAEPKRLIFEFTQNANETLLIQDDRALGWPGTKTDCVENTVINETGHGELEATGSFVWSDFVQWQTWGRWNLLPNTLVYTTENIDLAGYVGDMKAFASASGLGVISVESRKSADGGETWTEWAELSALGEELTACTYQVRVSAENEETAANIPTIQSLIIYVSVL